MTEQTDRPNFCSVGEWLKKIKDGEVAIPRFQRGKVWNDRNVAELLEALFQRRPVGTLLLLEYSHSADGKDRHTFSPHPIEGAPDLRTTHAKEEKYAQLQLVLDGQQRLTALWSVFNDNESNEKEFFVRVEKESSGNLQTGEVDFFAGEQKKSLRDPKTAWDRNLIPIWLLGEPGITRGKDDLKNWCQKATDNVADKCFDLLAEISGLSEKLRKRDISFYQLPIQTSRHDAIHAFIKTNESSVKVTRFDIAVAELENRKEQSLREMLRDIKIPSDRLDKFFGDDEDSRIPTIGELVLKISCLMTDECPTDKYYTADETIEVLTERWDEIVKGIDWTLQFFEREGIYDQKRLPSVVPLRVLPALHQYYPEKDTDLQSIFDRVIRKYIWQSFVTERYKRSAASLLHEDYKGLAKNLKENSQTEIQRLLKDSDDSPIMNRKQYPIPNVRELSNLQYPLVKPSSKNRLSRALLVMSLRSGALDFASGKPVGTSTQEHQYHHLFPQAFLKEEGRKEKEINHALNFALVSEITNNRLRAAPPAKYLKDRMDKQQCSENEIARRVESHLIPFAELNVHTGKKGNYEKFLKRRAEIFVQAMDQLCQGEGEM